ncbi:MAG TPA: signal peptidase I [Candidatus Hydrogenedentes bacterium]|nr:signal peptidase I [Candidatus Hydrogenedentota bacterium]
MSESHEDNGIGVLAENPPPSMVPSQEIKREAIEFIKMVVWFLIAFFIVKTYIVEGYEVQGPSMNPTLNDRERILVFKLPHILSQFRIFSGIEALKEGDIVVFDSRNEPNKRYVKRIIARGPKSSASKTASAQAHDTPEDAVHVRFDSGSVYVNNRRILEPYLPPGPQSCDDRMPDVSLPPGTYYVLGDNRVVSKDSRSFGPIDDACLVGRAVLCFWPPGKMRFLR